ncbi:MAG: hypothetical protein HQM10_14545 [Candidatus Riflebacteria bacterium]|nr:hypothetical protein [Candidatus Riflebacteria bacterium]
MNDTTPELDKKYREMLMALSPVERMKMAGRMFSASKKLVEACILQKKPHIDEKQLRIEIFKRIYGQDFTELQIESIIMHLNRN